MHTPDETSDAFCNSGLPTRTVNPVASKTPNTSFAVHTMVFCVAMSTYSGKSAHWNMNALTPFRIMVTLAVNDLAQSWR